mmetsp:Transcript_659/g.1496  ORF Transcript_659/g.1496 Transcript_659/m.1496 type:complete len:317 (-) Transcript_659:2939-3889(-)
MYFNVDYSAFSSEVPLGPNSGFETGTRLSGLGNAAFGRPTVGDGARPVLADSQLKEQAYALWDDQQLGKTAGIRFERSPVNDNRLYKDFPRRKQRERSPSNVQDLYKTELCNSFTENGSCPYGANCQFAHGTEELRAVTRHPKYKTKLCRNFAEKGSCPYGSRCRFIHGNEDDSIAEQDGDIFPIQAGQVQIGTVPQKPLAPSPLYFRPPSPEVRLPPAFPAVSPGLAVPPRQEQLLGDGVLGFQSPPINAGSASAPTSRQGSPTPSQMSRPVPIRASTPTPQPSASVAELTDGVEEKTDPNLPKRRLAIFAKFAN